MSVTANLRANWPLISLLALALLVRGSVLWSMRHNLEQDPDAYREIAENLLRHGEFALGHGEPESPGGSYRPTAYRPPLYPLVLSNLPAASGREISLAKVAAVHLALGLATVWLTWLTAKRFVGWDKRSAGPPPPLVPFLAALLIACDPILLNQQTLVMTETLATFLSILSLWCLAKFNDRPSWFNAARAGGTIGLAILCRPTFLPWLGLVLVTVAFVAGRQRAHLGWRFSNALVMALAAAAILTPWAIRNYRLFRKPILTTTHGGYTLYLGNNPSFYKHLSEGTSDIPWQASNLDTFVFAKNEPLTEEKFQLLTWLQAQSNEFTEKKKRWGYSDHRELFSDWAAYELAKKSIRENPTAFLLACTYRIGQLWSPLPHKLTTDESLSRRLLRYTSSAWYLAIYALAAVGVWKLRWNLLKPPWLYGLLLCLAFTAVHTFYWTNLRMRAPLMPLVALVAAASVTRADP